MTGANAPRAAVSPSSLDPVVLEGRFVRLEPLHHGHADDLLEAALSEPRIWDYMWMRVESAGDLAALIDGALASQASGLNLAFAAVERASGRAVGSTRFLDFQPAHRGVEIGWTWYHRRSWGGLINPEAKLLLLRHAFGPLSCMRVQLKTDARNERSRSAILRLGAHHEGVLRKHMIVQGSTVRDSAYYSILDDEWPAVEEGLAARLSG